MTSSKQCRLQKSGTYIQTDSSRCRIPVEIKNKNKLEKYIPSIPTNYKIYSGAGGPFQCEVWSSRLACTTLLWKQKFNAFKKSSGHSFLEIYRIFCCMLCKIPWNNLSILPKPDYNCPVKKWRIKIFYETNRKQNQSKEKV